MAKMTKPGFARDLGRLPSGRWPLQVYWYEGGQRQRARQGSYPSRKLRNEAGDRWVAEVLAGAAVRPSLRTVDDLLDAWIELGPQAGLRPRTLIDYVSKLDNHVRPAVGELALQDLEAHQLDAVYATMLAKGLAASTVRKVHAIVHKALHDAMRKRLVAVNVAARATPPPARAARAKERTIWTAEQLGVFLDALDGHQQQPILHTMAMTGLRRSEACGLKWSNVDVDAQTIDVVEGLTQTPGQLHTDRPKSERGRRRVDLDDETTAILRAHRQAQVAERLLVGAGYRDQGYVFARPDGAPWKPDSIGQAYRRIVARAGLPPIALHDLRHTHASLMLSEGIELTVVSDRLGHATAGFTLTTYAHSLPGRQATAAQQTANLVKSSGSRLTHDGPPTNLADRRTTS